MPAGVISVGGKKYAVGLFWQVSDTKKAARAAKQAAQQPGAESDFYSLRAGNARGRASQFGLTEKNPDYKWNIPSAAVSLANRQPGSWAGVFPVPEGVWFIEVRDDLIAPDGDQLFADEAEAMSRLQEVSARGGLERIYAPPAWALPGAESSSLPALLAGKRDGRLQPVRIPAKVFLSGVLAVGVVVALVVGYLIYAQMQEEAELEEQQRVQMEQQAAYQKQQEEKRRLEEEERLRQQQQQARQLPSYQRIWEQAPTPLNWLTACREAMTQAEIAPLGWKIDSAVCTGNQLNLRWSRTNGPAIIPEGTDIDTSMRSASKVIPLPSRPVRGPQMLWPADAIVTYVLQNDWKADLQYAADDPLPPAQNGQQMPPPPWKKRTMKWSVEFSPWTLKGPLVDLPGLIIQTATWSQTGSWTLEGVLYEQRN